MTSEEFTDLGAAVSLHDHDTNEFIRISTLTVPASLKTSGGRVTCDLIPEPANDETNSYAYMDVQGTSP